MTFASFARIACAILLLPLLALAQSATTSLTGTVFDPSGAAVPGATVVLTNTQNQATRESTTNGQGVYNFASIAPGEYRVSAKKEGFPETIVNAVRLLVSTPATLNITFEKVGSVSEVVSVSAEAIQLNTQDATLGNSFGTKPILQLPFEGRNVVGLLSLQPGVSYIGDADTVNGGSNVATDRGGVVNGGKSDQANVTLDGVDVNNQQTRAAFESVLRVTLDSVQEFRVTTTNANADAGRTSGPQITLVTKSGSNQLHGSAYWFVRNKAFNANTFFNNLSGLDTPKLNRNIIGGSLGGPIIKNRLFLFGNVEGREDRYEASVIRTVPTASFRAGNLQYIRRDGTTATVTPTELQQRLGVPVNQNVLNLYRNIPLPNDFSAGDGLNSAGYRFNTPLGDRYRTYVSRLDYVLNDKVNLFVRGQLQNDRREGAPQFPGQASNFTDLDNSKGIAVGVNGTLSPTFITTFRYGFTRQGVETAGIGTSQIVEFRNFDNPVGLTRSFRRFSPVHHISNDFTWNKGSHTVQFGGSARQYTNDRLNFAGSFFRIQSNSSWLIESGQGLSLPFTDMNPAFNTAFNDSAASILGLITQVTANYNYIPDRNGNVTPLAPGQGVPRNFRGQEVELFLQDTWKMTRQLTITAGLRFHHWPPVWETNGVQTTTNIPLSEWFDRRVAAANAGQNASRVVPRVSYQLSSQQGGRPLYETLNNWSPRLGIAYSPEGKSGLGRFFFGDNGSTVIRAGFGLYYDLIGNSLIRDFDASALGLSTSLNNPSGRQTITGAPRFQTLNDVPASLVTPPPPASFPVVAPDIFAITNSLDDRLSAPYSMRWNLSITRQFKGGWTVTGAYVGSGFRRSLTSEDLATPLNLRDPQSGQTWRDASRILTREVQRQLAAGVSRSAPNYGPVTPLPFFENLYPNLRDAGRGLTATQSAFRRFMANYADATFVQEIVDTSFGSPSIGDYAMYSPQYSYLRALRTVGNGNYHSMQWNVRKRWDNGDQVDFNYTWSHSIDLSSTSENSATAGRGILIDPYNRASHRASSDFDTRHSWNANWVYNLPLGRGGRFGSGVSSFVDALIGGWQLSGLYRQTTGLPTSVGHGRTWPTNYNWTGYATQIGAFEDGTNKNAPAPTGGRSGPNIFQDPVAARNAFDFTLPGDIGSRNVVRGDGVFNIDLGLAKNFKMPYAEGHTVQFRWETFNVTNSVRFDPQNINLGLGSISNFGRYLGTLGGPRVMQFGLRYDF